MDLTLREIQSEEMEIMDDIHSFCISNGIRYSLSYGSLLGAVRHRGFIPWDDDMDLWMTRPNYDRFLRTYRSGEYVLKQCADGSLYAPMAKVCNQHIGVDYNIAKISEAGFQDNKDLWVDIFPVDGIPENRTVAAKTDRAITRMLRQIMGERFCFSGRNPLESAVGKMVYRHYRDVDPLELSKRIEDLCRTGSFEDSKMAVDYIGRPQSLRPRFVFERKVFDSYIPYEFEGGSYYGVEDYDTVLTIEYGDYMTPPPESQRIGHAQRVYRRDEG